MRRLCKWGKFLKRENARRKWIEKEKKTYTNTWTRDMIFIEKPLAACFCVLQTLSIASGLLFVFLRSKSVEFFFRFSFFPFKKSFVHEFLWFSVCVWVVYSFVVGYANVYMYLWLERIEKTTELLWCFKPKLYRFRTIHLKTRVFFHFTRLHSFFLSLNASSIVSRARTVHAFSVVMLSWSYYGVEVVAVPPVVKTSQQFELIRTKWWKKSSVLVNLISTRLHMYVVWCNVTHRGQIDVFCFSPALHLTPQCAHGKLFYSLNCNKERA